MKLDATKFGLAAAIVAAIAWLVSRLVWLARPFGAMHAGGRMVHAGGRMMGPGHPHLHALGWIGFAVGLVLWPLIAGLMAWGTAAIYNRLLR